jgi:hypothetical protein
MAEVELGRERGRERDREREERRRCFGVRWIMRVIWHRG